MLEGEVERAQGCCVFLHVCFLVTHTSLSFYHPVAQNKMVRLSSVLTYLLSLC